MTIDEINVEIAERELLLEQALNAVGWTEMTDGMKNTISDLYEMLDYAMERETMAFGYNS